jgi:flagellar protein FliS
MLSSQTSLDSSNPVEPTPIPEHMVVILLEGGQRLLAKAGDAIRQKDSTARDFYLKKVNAVLRELVNRLNHEQGGDLVDNLVRVYDWWGCEISAACSQGDLDRIRVVSEQLGDIRRAWEFVLFKGEGMSESPEL